MELEIKRSRFLATAVPLAEGEPAEARLGELRCAEASHNCWAWRSGEAFRSSDDGEPGGTAGRPILAAIDGAGIDRVLLRVARWFGGIKLGAGGLVRAYGGAAAECLRQAPKQRIEPQAQLSLAGGFEQLGTLYALASRYQARVIDEYHAADGARWRLQLDRARRDEFLHALAEATRGRIRTLTDAR